MQSMRFPLTILALSATLAVSASADGRMDDAGKPAAGPGFPTVFLKSTPELQRFSDPQYFSLLAADGIRSADPKALFERIAAASQAGESYKALYLSRLFTELQPANQTGWANRSRLAASLGFAAEAAASQANAETGASRPVAGAALPGSIKARPTSLSDWAAAMALVADDVAAREGRAVVLAVRDDTSGLEVASDEEIQRENRGPWATAKPVQLEDVLSNLFALPQATPMDRKSMKGGMFALGALAMAASAYSSSIGAVDAASQYSELYGNAMAKAFEVPSEFKGGSFVAMTYADGSPRPANLKPKTAGKREAVGTPLALLWASGPSLQPTVSAAWRNGDSTKSEAIRIDAKTKKQEWKKHAISTLAYPRMQQLCVAATCSPRVSLLEVMLTADDVRTLAPGAETRLPDLSSWIGRYASRQPISVVAAGEQFTGYDASGVVYVTRHRPTEWLVTAAPAPTGKK